MYFGWTGISHWVDWEDWHQPSIVSDGVEAATPHLCR